MTFSKFVLVSIFALGFLSVAADAKQFRVPLAGTAENGDGAYLSPVINEGYPGAIQYELIPANDDVAASLKAKRCPDGARVEGSILSRTLEIDHENHRPGTEVVRILARKLGCIAP